MTLAEIRTAVRNLINEQSTDVGALLDGNTILDEFINAAVEDVVLDLLPFMMDQFMTTETVTLIAAQANYTLTNSFWAIYKIERNVSGEKPKEIQIIDPLEFQEKFNVGDTAEYPDYCYFLGDTLYFAPTPDTAVTNYAKVYLIRPEAASMAVGGPAYIPRPAHRLIVYKACALVATMSEAKVPFTIFEGLYANRLEKTRRVWIRRFQSKPRFVRKSIAERTLKQTDSADKDNDWL